MRSKSNQLEIPIQRGIGCNIFRDKMSASSSKILNNGKNTTTLRIKIYTESYNTLFLRAQKPND